MIGQLAGSNGGSNGGANSPIRSAAWLTRAAELQNSPPHACARGTKGVSVSPRTAAPP